MKNIFLIPFFILLFASTGWCIQISDTDANGLNGVDVGSIDTFIDFTTLSNSNPETETNWVNETLAPITVASSIKEEEGVPYYKTNADNIFAYFLDTPPETEYFLFKNSTYRALFKNIGLMSWAVFDSTDLPEGMNIPNDDFTISHVTRFDAAAPVPEPATVFLLGSGLLGLGWYGRKRKKA